MQPQSQQVLSGTDSTFSPLFIGVIGATSWQPTVELLDTVPFSPLFIGVIGATGRGARPGADCGPFSPLFIGVIGATWMNPPFSRNLNKSFSPLFIGVIGATHQAVKTDNALRPFQSPIHRGDRCNLALNCCTCQGVPLSVPYSSG